MKYMIIALAGLLVWAIIIIGTLQQDLDVARKEIAGHWRLVKVYHSQIDAWADYQADLKAGKKATWDVKKERK